MRTAITTADMIKRAALSIDQADLVQELLASREAYSAYLKVVRRIVEGMEGAVIQMSSSQGPEALFQAKLRAEGARKLFDEMQGLNKKA